MPRGCPGAHHKLITRLLLILNRATGEVNLLTTMLLAPTTAAIRTPSDWHKDPATPSRPPPLDTAGAGSRRPCLCRRRIRDPRAVLVPSIPPSLASSRGLQREIDTGLAALSSASDPHPDAMVIVEFDDDDDDLLGEEEPTPSRSALATVTVGPRCPYIPSSHELWRCPAPRPPPRCLPRWRVAAPPSPPLASWCKASSRRRRLHPLPVAALWGRPTHGFLHSAGFLSSLRPQAQPRPPPSSAEQAAVTVAASVAGRTPLVPRLQVAIPLPPPVVRRGQPPKARATGPHRPYAGGRVPPPPPPPPVLSRGILGSWPPPRPPPPQPPTVGSGCTRCAASKAPPFASGSTSHRSAAPSLSPGRAWIHGGRQAHLCPAGGHGWFYRGRSAQAPGFSLTASCGFALAALVADRVSADLLGKCFNFFGLNHVTAHCFRAPLLQLLSTRTSQELLPVAVHGSSYSYVPARSTRLWPGMCPASASSTLGSRGAAAPWGASSPPG
jgi:hypothetical protein